MGWIEMASSSKKRKAKKSEEDDLPSDVSSSWLFRRMISHEFSKGEDEWEMSRSQGRRRHQRRSKKPTRPTDGDVKEDAEDSEEVIESADSVSSSWTVNNEDESLDDAMIFINLL